MTKPSDPATFLTRTHLELVVPLLMLDLETRGGPDEDDFSLLKEISDDWQQAPALIDSLVRAAEGGGNGKVWPAALQRIAEGLAILAFCPGGVTFLGTHFEAQR